MIFDYLITGSNGYIAKILIKKLVKDNKKLITVSKYREQKNKNIHHIKSNIFSNFNLKKKTKCIIHMASKNFFTQNVDQLKEVTINFDQFIKSNIQTTIKICEFAKKNKVSKVIFFSSLAIYGKSNLKTISNKSSYYDIDFYGLTKLMSESVLRDYSKHFSVYILRIPGVLDEHQNVPWPWLNEVKNKIKDNKNITFFNPKKKFNSLTSIGDIAKIIKHINKKSKKKDFQIYNFGGNKPQRIIDILNKIKKKYQSKSKFIIKNSKKHSSIIDNSYIERDLGLKLSSVESIISNFLKKNI